MRLRIGPIPENPDFRPSDAGWHALREPSPRALQLIALPVGLLATAAILFGWSWTVAHGTRVPTPTFVPGVLLAFVITIPLHELAHLLLHPKAGRSTASIIGFWPTALLCYAHYDDALARNRFIVLLLAPFVFLSVLPLLACALFGEGRWWIVVISAMNALAACVDLTGIVLVLFQVPSKATVRNRGYYTWWIQATSKTGSDQWR